MKKEQLEAPPKNEPLLIDKETLFKENLAYLNSRLKYLGFGENTALNRCLEEEMRLDQPSFELYTEAFYDEETKLEARLNFGRGKTGDRYYFNRYTALLRYTDNPEKQKQQTFYIDKGAFGVTFKEAFNLLQGRSVYKKLSRKDGEKYMSWISLDFAEKTLSGNYKTKYLFDRFPLEKYLMRMKYGNSTQRYSGKGLSGRFDAATFIRLSFRWQAKDWPGNTSMPVRSQIRSSSFRRQRGPGPAKLNWHLSPTCWLRCRTSKRSRMSRLVIRSSTKKLPFL